MAMSVRCNCMVLLLLEMIVIPQLAIASVCETMQPAHCVRDVGGNINSRFHVVVNGLQCQKLCEEAGIVNKEKETRCCSFAPGNPDTKVLGLCEIIPFLGDEEPSLVIPEPITWETTPPPGTRYAGVCRKRTGQKQPHVLLIVVDDAGVNDFDWSPSNAFATPIIRQLANDGVYLTKHYGCPVCAPSRFSLHTGRHAVSMGLGRSNIKPYEAVALDPQFETIAEGFKRLGYSTYGFGKWHLGHSRLIYTPGYRGYDYYYGGLLGSNDHYSHIKEIKTDKQNTCVGVDLRRCELLNITTDTSQEGVYSTDLFTQQLLDKIERQPLEETTKAKSAFMYLGYNAPHSPFQAPDKLVAKFVRQGYVSPKSSGRALLAAMMRSVDINVGRIMRALKSNDMWHDTITVIMSDNGGARTLARSQAVVEQSNHPLRGGKATMFEGGVRTCALIHTQKKRLYPTRWTPLPRSRLGRPYEELFFLSDWKHTLLDAAGGDADTIGSMAALGGVSHWGTLVDEAQTTEPPRDTVVLNLYSSPRCLRDNGRSYCGGLISNNWKILMVPEVDQESKRYYSWIDADEATSSVKTSVPPIECGQLRNRVWMMEKPCTTKSPCLFNLNVDPCEYRNLATEKVNIFNRLDDLMQLNIESSPVPQRPDRASEVCTAVSIRGDWGLWLDDPQEYLLKYIVLPDPKAYSRPDLENNRVFLLRDTDFPTCVETCNENKMCKGMLLFVPSREPDTVSCAGLSVFEGQGEPCHQKTCKSYARIRYDDGSCRVNGEKCKWPKQCCSRNCSDGTCSELIDVGSFDEIDEESGDDDYGVWSLQTITNPTPSPTPSMMVSMYPCSPKILDNYLHYADVKPKMRLFSPLGPWGFTSSLDVCAHACMDIELCVMFTFNPESGVCDIRSAIDTHVVANLDFEDLFKSRSPWQTYQKMTTANCLGTIAKDSTEVQLSN